MLLIGCVSCALFILNGLTGKITAKALGFALIVLMPITLRWIRIIVVLHFYYVHTEDRQVCFGKIEEHLHSLQPEVLFKRCEKHETRNASIVCAQCS